MTSTGRKIEFAQNLHGANLLQIWIYKALHPVQRWRWQICHRHICTGCKALKSSYLQHICKRKILCKFVFSSCDHHRILKTNIRHYDVISYTMLWRPTNLCCLCQMREKTNGRLLQGKGLQIQINNKTIIEFGSRGYEEFLRPRFVLSASAFGFG